MLDTVPLRLWGKSENVFNMCNAPSRGDFVASLCSPWSRVHPVFGTVAVFDNEGHYFPQGGIAAVSSLCVYPQFPCNWLRLTSAVAPIAQAQEKFTHAGTGIEFWYVSRHNWKLQ
jgi:hypothetical protein